MEMISQDILMQAVSGDTEAFEKIYNNTSGFVYSVAFRIVGNYEDAREVTQDVFIKIHRDLKNFRFESSFKTWVYRITVNTAINVCRKRSKTINTIGDYDIAIETSSNNATRQTLDTNDNEKIIASLLSILNPDQRTCIILREIEGLNYKQISETLHININTVRSRLKRAREILLEEGKKRGDKNEL